MNFIVTRPGEMLMSAAMSARGDFEKLGAVFIRTLVSPAEGPRGAEDQAGRVA